VCRLVHGSENQHRTRLSCDNGPEGVPYDIHTAAAASLTPPSRRRSYGAIGSSRRERMVDLILVLVTVVAFAVLFAFIGWMERV
jgi:hypothetical protein